MLTLSNEFFGCKAIALEVRVKMLYGEDKTTIIGQYVRFCKVLSSQFAIYKYSDKTISETIRICKDEDVLKAYLAEHEKEAISIMMTLFKDDFILDAYKLECIQEGEVKDRIKNIQGMRSISIPDDLIAKALGISIEEVAAVPVK